MMLEPYLKVGGKEGANWEWQGLLKPQISLPMTHLLQQDYRPDPSQRFPLAGDQVFKYILAYGGPLSSKTLHAKSFLLSLR